MNTENKNLAEKLFPKIDKNISYYLEKYPPRNLVNTAKITRVAPSPTGQMHIGGLYMALISKKAAEQSNGIFFLRIEDTDKKREIAGAEDLIIKALETYSLTPDEGPTVHGILGEYGPYVQSERMEIYQTFAKHLLEQGRAYPCFATEEELTSIRSSQEAATLRLGYYGEFAIWRNKTDTEVEEALQAGKPFVIRFKATNLPGTTITINDLVRKEITMPANDHDFVLIKSDGLPTYHLAHLVDDHLMGTTDVLRADEWISSLAIHHDLFTAFNFPLPKYGHISPIQKMDAEGKKRKLSKRKDPEASVVYYDEKGYPEDAVIEYLMNLADASFEPWRKENPNTSIKEFTLGFNGLGGGGPLFDEVKLRDISKGIIARMTAEELFEKVYAWASKYDLAFKNTLEKNKDYSIRILNIERGGEKPRRDIAAWSQMPNEFEFFFTKDFLVTEPFTGETALNESEQKDALQKVLASYNPSDDKDTWFEKMQSIGSEFGLAPNTKSYKQNPKSFKGQIGNLTQLVRYVVTGRQKTPDLYSILSVLGEAEIKRRFDSYLK